MTIRKKFLHTLDLHHMVEPGDRILVAVSGGPDSVALLHLFLEIHRSRRLEILVAHFHHGLREREADGDLALVRSLAARRGLPFHTGRMRPPETSASLEEYARDQRYGFLRSVAERTGARRIAVGHQQDDQAETLLMRLLRGSGRRGLAGIHPKREDLVIRPLLEISRREIVDYLFTLGALFREDTSNRDLRFTRNRIRHELIPGLVRDFNPEVVRTLARTADRLREEDDLLERITERELTAIRNGSNLAVDRLDCLPEALRRRVLLRALEDYRGSRRRISSRHIDALLGLIPATARGKRVILPGGMQAVRSEEWIRFQCAPEPAPPPAFQEFLPVPGRCELPRTGLSFQSRIQTRDSFPDPIREGGRDRAILDADRVRHPLIIRARRPGDRFRPFGGPGGKTIKKFFIDRKVPAAARDRWPLITCGEDIVWVVGQQIDDRYRVRPSTRSLLILSRLLPVASRRIPSTSDSLGKSPAD